MKQLITYLFLLITVLVRAQTDTVNPLRGTWYVSMLGVNLDDTTIYRIPKEESQISFEDVLEQKFYSTRYYIRNPKPLYIRYDSRSDNRKGTLLLYKTKKERRKRMDPLRVEYLSEKGLLFLIEPETAGISSESGFPTYDKLTVLTKIPDSLHWNKLILGSWNSRSFTPLFDLKIGDTCRFTKANLQTDNQLRFDLNSGFANCKIKEKPSKPPVQSNGILDGVYIRDPWLSFSYGIDLEKSQITFLGSFGMSFRIIELTDNSLVLIKQFFQL